MNPILLLILITVCMCSSRDLFRQTVFHKFHFHSHILSAQVHLWLLLASSQNDHDTTCHNHTMQQGVVRSSASVDIAVGHPAQCPRTSSPFQIDDGYTAGTALDPLSWPTSSAVSDPSDLAPRRGVLLIALVLHHAILIASGSHTLGGGKHTFFPSALRSSLAA